MRGRPGHRHRRHEAPARGRRGVDENTTLVKALLVGLRERAPDHAQILAVLDGARAQAAAVTGVFGHRVTGRCHLHERRNVRVRLPEKLRRPVELRMRAAHWNVVQTAAGLTRAAGVVQLLVLSIPVLGMTITIIRVGRRSAAGAGNWAAGSAIRRFSVLTAAGLLVALLAVAWWPDSRVTPYRPGERGTVTQGIRDVSAFRQGTPLLRSPQEAAQPLPPVAVGTSAVAGPDQTQPGRATGARPNRT